MAANGRTIIKDAIAHCPDLTDKFVDVDNEIASNHDFEFDEVLPFEVINKTCAEAQTSAAEIGFDGYIDPPGNVHVFKRGKYNSSVSLQIEEYNRSRDSHRIRNKIKVYGKAERPYPADKDAWTEHDGIEWSTNGDSILTDYTDKKMGDASIGALRENATNLYIERSIPQVKCGSFNSWFKNLNLFIKWNHSGGEKPYSLHIELKDSNGKTTRYYGAKHLAGKYEWSDIQNLGIGEKHEDVWEKVAGERADWSDIVKIRFTLLWENAGNLTIKLDVLHFNGARFEGTVSDSASIAKYGIRWAPPQVHDDLVSDAECELKAKSLIEYLKEEVELFHTLRVEGNHFTPGDLVHVIISNDGISAWHRIAEVTDIVEGMTWDSILKVSNKPKMIDYMMLHKAQVIVQAMEEQRSGAGAR